MYAGAAPGRAATVPRGRVLAAAAILPPLLGYLALAVLLVLVTGLASGAAFSLGTAFAAAGPAWLAACHVPLVVAGAPLGVLPLLLTAMVVALAARSGARAAARLGLSRPAQAWPVIGAVGGAHAAVGLLVALVGGSAATAAPASAFFICGTLGAAAATAGLARRCGLVSWALAHVGPVLPRGLRVGVLALAALVAAGAVTYLLGMLTALPQAAALFGGTAPGVGGAFGLFLLCLVYLPNALVGGLSFALGSGVTIGSVTAGPLAYHGGGLPAFPLLAALPDQFAPWWPLLFLLPLAAGVAVGQYVRLTVAGTAERLRVLAVAGLVVAVALLVLAALAGGALGGGAFGPVTIPAGLLAVTGFGWIVAPGALVCRLGDGRPVPFVGSVTTPEHDDVAAEEPGEWDEPHDEEEPYGEDAEAEDDVAGEAVADDPETPQDEDYDDDPDGIEEDRRSVEPPDPDGVIDTRAT